MEQGTYANPNPQSLERTSCQCLFKPDGASSYDDFGPIEIVKVALNQETDKVMFAIDGANVLGAQENTSISPVLSFKGRQYTDRIKPYLNMGTVSTDASQASGSGATITVTAALGKTFDLGARNITFTSATVSASAKVRDTDFYIDEKAGLIRFPEIAAGIAASASVVVTFDKPAITRKSYVGGSTLNFYGALLLIEKDNKSSVPRAEWLFATGYLSPKELGDIDIKKNKDWGMDFSVSGQWTRKDRVA